MGKKQQRRLNKGTFTFAIQSTNALLAARWSPTRSVSTDIYEAAFREEHLQLHATAQRFLQSFGGLVIKYTTTANESDVLSLCADDAVRGMGNEGLAQLEDSLAVHPLCPIGLFDEGLCMLLQHSSGKVYGASDDAFFRVGDSGEQAIDNILTGHHLEVVTPG